MGGRRVFVGRDGEVEGDYNVDRRIEKDEEEQERSLRPLPNHATGSSGGCPEEKRPSLSLRQRGMQAKEGHIFLTNVSKLFRLRRRPGLVGRRKPCSRLLKRNDKPNVSVFDQRPCHIEER